jgi:Zn-dependent protease
MMSAAAPPTGAENAHATTSPPPRRKGVGAAIGAGLLVVAAKAKVLLVALKALKFGKIFITMGSMAVMIAVEARRGGWAFAAGFVLLILIHEIGHGVEIKRAGLQAGYPVFIPFFGALISLRGQPRSPIEEARIAFAGPLWGAAAALATAALYLATRQRLLLSIAYSGFFLNLFNLTPLGFLDGGRVTKVFARRAWIVGLAIFVALFAMTQAPQLLLIGIMAMSQIWSRRGSPEEAQAAAAVDPRARRDVAIRYFGLCAVLAAGVAFSRMLIDG